jgi:hypothetical protein
MEFDRDTLTAPGYINAASGRSGVSNHYRNVHSSAYILVLTMERMVLI